MPLGPYSPMNVIVISGDVGPSAGDTISKTELAGNESDRCARNRTASFLGEPRRPTGLRAGSNRCNSRTAWKNSNAYPSTNRRSATVMIGQWSVVSCQLSVVSCQLQDLFKMNAEKRLCN